MVGGGTAIGDFCQISTLGEVGKMDILSSVDRFLSYHPS